MGGGWPHGRWLYAITLSNSGIRIPISHCDSTILFSFTPSLLSQECCHFGEVGNYIFTFFLSNNFPPFNVQCAPISIGGKHYLAVSIFPLTSLLFARQRVAKAVKRQKFHGNEGILRSKQFLPGKAV